VNADVSPGAGVADQTPPTLARHVLAELEAAGIAHCHWKSNDHLAAALDGDTDVDLLVDGERLDDVYRTFVACGLRRGRVAPTRTEVGLEDFLGHDRATGALVHFHTHYRLVTGERHLKRYRLPWERAVLASAVRSDAGVLVPDPSMEASLLLIRAALKVRTRDLVGTRLGGRDPSWWFRAELDALRARTTDADIVARIESWLGGPCARAVADALAGGIDARRLVRLRRLVRASLALQTAHRGPGAALSRWRREWAWFQRGVSRRYLDRPKLYGRGLPGGGLLVVVIGPDGSGKSSVVADLRRWFSPKFDTMVVYFGSGDGPASALRWPMKALRDVVRGEHRRRPAADGRDREVRSGWAKALWALALAREKRQRLQRAFDGRNRGLLVICDRYPQAQRPGINDGPLLHGWSGGGVRSRLARWEARPYELAERFPPDLVIRLRVDQGTAERRRPDHDPDDLARRRALVSQLAFPDARYGTVEVDAGQPYEEVLEAVKGAVWRCL
jgi:thymidylate kinase